MPTDGVITKVYSSKLGGMVILHFVFKQYIIK